MLLVLDTKLYFVCPCPNASLAAAHKALTSEGKQCVLASQRGETWHVAVVTELCKRKAV